MVYVRYGQRFKGVYLMRTGNKGVKGFSDQKEEDTRECVWKKSPNKSIIEYQENVSGRKIEKNGTDELCSGLRIASYDLPSMCGVPC